MRSTLRLRLTLLTAGVLAIALTVGAVLLVQLLERGRIEALDDAATARVATVADLVRTDRLPDALGVAQPGEVVQLLALDGGVVATSSNASLTLPVVSADVRAELEKLSGAGADGSSGDADPRDPIVVTARSSYAGQARVAALLATLPGEAGGAGDADGSGAAAPTRVLVVAAVPLGDVSATVRALGLSLAAVVPVLVLGLGAVVWLVLGRALRPVEELRVAADDVVAAGGPGSLPVPRSGELAALATTLNAMLDRLDGAVASARAAADSARGAAERQRAFVADAAHELRSPLASLGTALEVAATHPDSYPREELVTDLRSDVARMQVLVEDLLLLARLGSRPLAREALALGQVVAAAVTEVGGEVDVVGDGAALGDAVATTRVLRNLLANAARHARATVAVTVADGAVTVDDDGAGIRESERERVFERFVRLDEARERDAGGSGLGLAIARELAREQGGDVMLATSPAGGLRATLRLPTR
ncbi:sensor histidine kinase [Serinibacter arcticus]|uniref:histidine kinase n=1 Tax=Serinibacter arcticus TaxID=1655435 RepID=A0A4Z1E5P6_9MICO|nr:ATP-binding protein [Serinibacter arcticus]TGO06640.1 periplasmic sensor signal transduction histidine kinase [Serinibacter arcticus]